MVFEHPPPQSELEGAPELPDHPLRVGLDGVPGELVLDVVEEVTHGVLVLELLHTAVHSEQDLVELDCQLEQNSHEAISVESLEERSHLKTIILVLSLLSSQSHQVKYEQHLLLSLHQLDQLVPDEVQDAAELVEAAVVPDGVGDGQDVGLIHQTPAYL